jgi:hypothetical protein
VSFKLLITVVSTVLATVALSAQSQSRNINDSVMTPTIGIPLTIAEQFVNQLRIDIKAQGPAVDEILIGATRQGAAIDGEMLDIRRQMANAALRKQPDEMKTLVGTYTEAATKMVTLETDAFRKVVALLRPNQQSRAPEAFTIMAGIFLIPPPAAPRPQQGGRR